MPRDAQELPDTVATARQIIKGLQRQLRAAAQVLARLEELLDEQPTRPRTAELEAQHGNESTADRPYPVAV